MEEKIIIDGGKPLDGKTRTQGSKNSALPILAAAAAINGTSVIHNCPDLVDVSAALKILEYIGCKTGREGGTVTVDASNANRSDIPPELMRETRSSIIFLGALLARFGKSSGSPPGGCEIGLRPIDLHLSSLRAMGAEIEENGCSLECRSGNGLKGTRIDLPFPSVGATENVMLAAMGAEGETLLANAAREPEIVDLANFLNSCGASVRGAGGGALRISRAKPLRPTEHKIIPDRVVASTFMACCAAAGGKITVEKTDCAALAPVIPVFEETGCKIKVKGDELTVAAPKRLRSVKSLVTAPYPGFPTDSQAILTSALATAEGESVITETIFENRFKHVPELIKMGAEIKIINGRSAAVKGVERLKGARTVARDLRGGCALIVAALGAEGETVVSGVRHIYRGFEAPEARLSELGANIRKI